MPLLKMKCSNLTYSWLRSYEDGLAEGKQRSGWKLGDLFLAERYC